MSFVISSAIPFPNIAWWARAAKADTVQFDLGEHFEKMSYRNRYYIAGANGLQALSIPVSGGRNNRSAVKDTGISNDQNWQQQHWRTLFSAYNRSPYFGFYASSLERLFTEPFDKLAEFNLKTTGWLLEQTGIALQQEVLTEYRAVHPGNMDDLRKLKPGIEHCDSCDFPPYHQVFQERQGFHPNLSMLDLLFAEGPYTKKWLSENGEAVIAWTKKPEA